MSELEVLLNDYFRDGDYIASQMIAWCEPSNELILKIKKYENRHKAWKRRKKDGIKPKN